MYDPVADQWSPGPSAPKFQARSRVLVRTNRKGQDPKLRDHDDLRRLGFEYPPGTSMGGRMYWFTAPGPIWFDSALGAWAQGEPPIRQKGHGLAPNAPVEDRWLSSVSTWVRHLDVTAAGPDGRIYLAGGIGHRQPHLPGAPEWNPKEIHSLLDSLEIYDPKTLQWTQAAPMKHARQIFAGTFGADGRLYVFGGYGHLGGVRQRPGETDESYEAREKEMAKFDRALTSVEVYDPKTNTWSDRAPMPSGRYAMGAALGADGRIHVVGGAERKPGSSGAS